MHAKIEWLENVKFEAVTGSGHRVMIDGPEDAGGRNEGTRPMELMLLGLGGCTSYDVLHILKKSRQSVTGCTTQLSATRAETPPQVFETIHIHFDVTGQNLDTSKVARAVELSAEKYCSASIMLERGGVKITHNFTVHQA